MSNPIDEVKKMITARQKRNTAYKNKSARRAGPESIIQEFLVAMEKVVSESKTPMDFDMGLEKEANLLESRMRSIDPGVKLEVVWNNSKTENWQDLQVEGVKIMWSSFYLGKNPFSDAEKYVDIAHLFLEGKLT